MLLTGSYEYASFLKPQKTPVQEETVDPSKSLHSYPPVPGGSPPQGTCPNEMCVIFSFRWFPCEFFRPGVPVSHALRTHPVQAQHSCNERTTNPPCGIARKGTTRAVSSRPHASGLSSYCHVSRQSLITTNRMIFGQVLLLPAWRTCNRLVHL